MEQLIAEGKIGEAGLCDLHPPVLKYVYNNAQIKPISIQVTLSTHCQTTPTPSCPCRSTSRAAVWCPRSSASSRRRKPSPSTPTPTPASSCPGTVWGERLSLSLPVTMLVWFQEYVISQTFKTSRPLLCLLDSQVCSEGKPGSWQDCKHSFSDTRSIWRIAECCCRRDTSSIWQNNSEIVSSRHLQITFFDVGRSNFFHNLYILNVPITLHYC